MAFVAVGNLSPAKIAADRDYALAAAAQPFLGSAGFKLIAIAAIVSTASAINATLYGAAKFTYLMACHGELPERLGEPIWDRPVGGLLATTLGTLVVVNTVNIEEISLMGSAGFLIIFAAGAERGGCSLEVGTIGRALELEIGWARVGEVHPRHQPSIVRSSSANSSVKCRSAATSS